MLDRESRDRLAGLIESFLGSQMKAFQFADEINQLSAETEDETVHHVVHALWYYYDDCDDHAVVLAKSEWDLIQRFILLLRSDAELHIKRRRCWTWRQPVAAIALLGFILVAARLGWGEHLFVVAIPFGLVSIMISKTQRGPSGAEQERLAALAPFVSTAQILSIRRRVTGFRKLRYPMLQMNRRIRSAFLDRMYALHAVAIWLMFSPLVLVFQVMPRSDREVTVNSA